MSSNDSYDSSSESSDDGFQSVGRKFNNNSKTYNKPTYQSKNDTNNVQNSQQKSQQYQNEPEFQKVVGKKTQIKKIYIFMISYDKNKGSQEKSTINLLANSLKDYVEYSFSEIKALADNSKLIREGFTETPQYVQWKFVWTIKEEFFEELLELEEILMRTAEIYFRREPEFEKKQIVKSNMLSPIKAEIKPQSNINGGNVIINSNNQKQLQQPQINSSKSNTNSSNNHNHINNNSNNNNSVQQQQQNISRKKQFNNKEAEEKYKLKKKYQELLNQNKQIREQNASLKKTLKEQENHTHGKITELKGCVDVLQIMLQDI